MLLIKQKSKIKIFNNNRKELSKHFIIPEVLNVVLCLCKFEGRVEGPSVDMGLLGGPPVYIYNIIGLIYSSCYHHFT